MVVHRLLDNVVKAINTAFSSKMWICSRVISAIVIGLLLLMNALESIEAASWKHVKPMYLVSMPAEMIASSESSSSVHIASAEDDGEEPMVLNLETEPMEDEMLPSVSTAMDRIFGGNVAHPNGFPYQAGFLLQRPKGLYWCGGSLISKEFVLTAAHCVDMATRALVFLGAHEIKNAKEHGQIRMMVNRTNFHIFPTWNHRRLKDDIALVRLPHAITFTKRMHPIQLPKRSFEYRNFKDKLAIASGWGRYATGVHAISNVLRFVKLHIIDGNTCKRSFPLAYRSTNICTSGMQSKSTCSGDSGGPLVLRYKNTKQRVLIGITSFGSIFGCDRGYPAAFTKVASYLDWISDEAGIDPHDMETSTTSWWSEYTSMEHDDESEHQSEGRYPRHTSGPAAGKKEHKKPFAAGRHKNLPNRKSKREALSSKCKKPIGYKLFIL